MTEAGFRKMALGLDGVVEASHMDHPDFRVGGRIFATLRADGKHGMVTVPPDQQPRFVKDSSGAFTSEAGAWGRAGSTRVHLKSVDEETLGEAMTLAWQMAVAKGPTKSNTKSTKRR